MFFLLILADCMFVVCFFVWLVRVSVTTLYRGCTGRPTLPGSICAMAHIDQKVCSAFQYSLKSVEEIPGDRWLF